MGSSPRGRGKQGPPYEVRRGVGLIPARAGKTRLQRRSYVWRGAHPRAGGENLCVCGGVVGDPGSSPRGRGKRPESPARWPLAGLIPARAGKTPATPAGPSARPAHPRAGGENTRPQWAHPDRGGSSPRGRGKPHDPRVPGRRRRLIPARAGKTNYPSQADSVKRAHPRAGGENVITRRPLPATTGSSPRGRGKPQTVRPRGHERGLIPARAGKTTPPVGALVCVTAHPRAGGENVRSATSCVRMSGSSPRGRGKPCKRCSRKSNLRLIPARAGKTRTSA